MPFPKSEMTAAMYRQFGYRSTFARLSALALCLLLFFSLAAAEQHSLHEEHAGGCELCLVHSGASSALLVSIRLPAPPAALNAAASAAEPARPVCPAVLALRSRAPPA